MTARQVTSYMVACNICGDDLPPIADEEESPRFASVLDAVKFVTDAAPAWGILRDGYALCGKRDEDHEHVRENIPALNPEGR